MVHGHLLQEILLLSFKLSRIGILINLERWLSHPHHHWILLAHASQKWIHHKLILLWRGRSVLGRRRLSFVLVLRLFLLSGESLFFFLLLLLFLL